MTFLAKFDKKTVLKTIQSLLPIENYRNDRSGMLWKTLFFFTITFFFLGVLSFLLAASQPSGAKFQIVLPWYQHLLMPVTLLSLVYSFALLRYPSITLLFKDTATPYTDGLLMTLRSWFPLLLIVNFISLFEAVSPLYAHKSSLLVRSLIYLALFISGFVIEAIVVKRTVSALYGKKSLTWTIPWATPYLLLFTLMYVVFQLVEASISR